MRTEVFFPQHLDHNRSFQLGVLVHPYFVLLTDALLDLSLTSDGQRSLIRSVQALLVYSLGTPVVVSIRDAVLVSNIPNIREYLEIIRGCLIDLFLNLWDI